MARLVLSQGENVGVASGTYQVFGTTSGTEQVDIYGGNATLDPSFNTGGDTVTLPGNPGDYTATRTGSSVTLTNGSTSVTIPVGTSGLNVVFRANEGTTADDTSRSLLFNTTSNQVELGGQAIGSSPTTVSGGSTTAPSVTVDPATITEGDSGTQLLTFTLHLNNPPASGSTTVSYSTADGSALANSDYQPVAGTVTFAAGQTTATVTVPIIGDLIQEGTETFTLNVIGNNIAAQGTATIIDNDTNTALTANTDTFTSQSTTTYTATNNNLNAGDRVTANGANDTLILATDNQLANHNFAGFTLAGVENLIVTNDTTTGGAVRLDLSGTTGLQTVESLNSSASVQFNQIPNLVQNVVINDLTNSETTANVRVQFQDAAVVGDNSLNVMIENSNADLVQIGSVSSANSGIETVNLMTSGGVLGASTISQLDTNLTTLNISGDANLTIDDPLNTTVRQIDATGQTGDLSLGWENNSAGVTYTGGDSNQTIGAGSGGDSITTGAGNDYIVSDGGSDIVAAGGGSNTVYAGSGNDTVTTSGGAGNVDYIDLGNGSNSYTAVNQAAATHYVVGGNGFDTINGGDGADYVYTGGNNNGVDDHDIVNTYAGNDFVNISAGGLVQADLGSGDDIVYGGTAFDASTVFGEAQDSLAFGSGTDELQITANVTDAQMDNVSSLEVLTLATGGLTATLNDQDGVMGDSNSQAAGLTTINLSNGSDTVDAADFTSGLTVNATTFSGGSDLAAGTTSPDYQQQYAGGGGGSDTVTTGSGDDVFNMNSTLDNSDVLNAGDGNDTLNINGFFSSAFGPNSGLTAPQFSHFETINLQSGYDTAGNYVGGDGSGNGYQITLSDNNAPDNNGTLTIDGSDLQRTADLYGALNDEFVYLDTTAVTAFGIDVTTGAADDFLTLGETDHMVSTQGGDDQVSFVGATTGTDTIDTGDGRDLVILDATAGGGSVSGTTGADDDILAVGTAGSTEQINLGSGNDVLGISGANGVPTVTTADGDNINGGGADEMNTVTFGNGAATFGNNTFNAIQNFQVMVNLQAGNTFNMNGGDAAGIRYVVDADNGGASTYNAAGYTSALTVDLEGGNLDAGPFNYGALQGVQQGGGNDTVTTGSGDDIILLATGNNTLSLGAGNDTIYAQAGELTTADVINGGTNTAPTFDATTGALGGGGDAIVLDNSSLYDTVGNLVGGTVNAAVSLTNVTNVEKFVLAASGDLGVGGAADINDNTLTFSGGTATSLTQLYIDGSALQDSQDSFTTTIAAGTGTNYAFNFTTVGAGAVDETLVKNNTTVQNNITYVGGDLSNDTLVIGGNNLGSSISFDGGTGSGIDTISAITGAGQVQDDGFAFVQHIEQLTTTAINILGANVDYLSATLGAQAAASGLDTVIGGSGGGNTAALSDNVVFDSQYLPVDANGAAKTTTVILGGGGRDTFDASASAATFAFEAQSGELTANDTLRGGTGRNDTLTIHVDSASSNVNGISGIETINLSNEYDTMFNTETYTLTAALNYAVTINATSFDDTTGQDALVLNAGNSTGNLTVNSGVGADTLTTGSGNDTINTGYGSDTVNAGAGNDTVNVMTRDSDNNTVNLSNGTATDHNYLTATGSGFGTLTVTGGAGIDEVTTTGDTSYQVVNTLAGNDIVHAGAGGGTFDLGDGNDSFTVTGGTNSITGGLGLDTMSLGSGVDTLIYNSVAESSTSLPTSGGKDVVSNFTSGQDHFDFTAIANGTTLYFDGNAATFGDAQGAIRGNDGRIDIVYEQDNHTLWVDVNDDGILNGQDLQIVVNADVAGQTLQLSDFIGATASPAPTNMPTPLMALAPADHQMMMVDHMMIA